MRMTVFTAGIDREPRPAAELAALGWTSGADDYVPRLAPAVRDHVIPLLRGAGRLPLSRWSTSGGRLPSSGDRVTGDDRAP
jgi:hypothetical protein